MLLTIQEATLRSWVLRGRMKAQTAAANRSATLGAWSKVGTAAINRPGWLALSHRDGRLAAARARQRRDWSDLITWRPHRKLKGRGL